MVMSNVLQAEIREFEIATKLDRIKRQFRDGLVSEAEVLKVGLEAIAAARAVNAAMASQYRS